MLVAGPVTGCGDGEGLTKAQYASRLSVMCEDFRQREKVIGEPRTIADLVTKGPRILGAYEQAIADKVGELKAPDTISDRAARLVELAQEQRDVLAALVAAARNGRVTTVQALVSKNAALNDEANSIAKDVGAHACT